MDFDPRTRVVQVHGRLLDLIVQEGLRPGSPFPSESELARRYGVSRGTVREALKLMERDGLLHVYHGRGRFVAAASALSISRPVTRFESVTEMLASRGYVLEIRVISVDVSAPTPDEVGAFGIDSGDRMVRLDRVRLYQGEVVVVSVSSFSASIFGGEDVHRVDFTRSLVELLRERSHGPVSSSAEIRAGSVPTRFSTLPEVDATKPWLVTNEVCVGRDGAFVLYSEEYHRGDFVSFHVLRHSQD